MNSILWKKTVIAGKDTSDGETPVCVVVTEEQNGFIIWLTGPDGWRVLRLSPWSNHDSVKWHMIDAAVVFSRYSLAELKKLGMEIE